MNHGSSRRLANLRIVAVFLLIFVVIYGVYTALLYLGDPFSFREFEQTRWAQGDPGYRATMSKDVIKVLPLGMTKVDTVELLGKPSLHELRGIVKLPKGTRTTHGYSLGCWSGIAKDAMFLWLHFDVEDKLVGTTIDGY